MARERESEDGDQFRWNTSVRSSMLCAGLPSGRLLDHNVASTHDALVDRAFASAGQRQ